MSVSPAALKKAAVAGRSSGVRAMRQRERILDAAEKCFIERGFHAASMVHIAGTAEISAGLIYRYFDSKSAIVRAIIERHLETDGCRRIDCLAVPEDFCKTLLDLFEHWRRRDNPQMNAALMLELTAESTRDPKLAEVVRAKDQMMNKAFTQAVLRGARACDVELTPAVAHGRAVILQCLVEGLASRAVRDPDLRRQVLAPVLEKVIAALMS